MIPLDALIFGVMTALWCLFGYYLTSHRLFGNQGKALGPFYHSFHPDRNRAERAFPLPRFAPKGSRGFRLPALSTRSEKFQ